MTIGFTGTRRGMTDKQQTSLVEMVRILPRLIDVPRIEESHDGYCIGADEEFCELVERYGFATSTHGHPGQVPHKLRASGRRDVMHSPLPIWTRNRIIAKQTLLIAAPYEMEEQPNGGTWGTVRIARDLGRPVLKLFPDGTVGWERRAALTLIAEAGGVR